MPGRLGLDSELPDDKNISCLVIAGMGGSAIAADMLAAYVSEFSPCPIHVSKRIPAASLGLW